MDMTSFVVGFARSKRKGASSRDALKVGLIGSTIGAGNPGLGIVAAEKVSERYVPVSPPVASTSGTAPTVSLSSDSSAPPAWARDLKKEIEGVGTRVDGIESELKGVKKSVEGLASEIGRLDEICQPTGSTQKQAK